MSVDFDEAQRQWVATLAQMKGVSLPDTDETYRGSGRTEGLMLIAIGNALLNPDEWVEFKDHHPSTVNVARNLTALFKDVVSHLKLTIDVVRKGNTIRLRSPFTRMKANHVR